jgi:hypothetical protein
MRWWLSALTGAQRLVMIAAVLGCVFVGLVVTAFVDALTATALTTLTALVMALVGVAWQVSAARQHAQKALSYNYFERWSSPEMLARREILGDHLAVGGRTADERWHEWEARNRPLAERLQILAVYGFFEELAGQYNRGELDHEATAEYLGRQAIELWEKSEWMIGPYRQIDANYFNELKRMLDEIRGPLERRHEAGRAAAVDLSAQEALELVFDPPELELSPMPAKTGKRAWWAGGR